MKFIVDFIPQCDTTTIQEYFIDNRCVVQQHLQWLGNTYIVESSQSPPQTETTTSVVQDRQVEIQPFGNQNLVDVISMHDEDAWWKLSTIDIKNYEVDHIVHYRNTLPVNVYVFDSGCDLTHFEFQNTGAELIYSYDSISGDSTGHGTAVASIIGGNTLSLVNVNLRILKIYGDAPTMLSHLLEALNTAISDHKSLGLPSIANFSWGVTKDLYLDSKFEQLFNHNIKVVCAAGSSNTSILELTPQTSAYTTVVGGYNQDFTPCDYTTSATLPVEQRGLVNTGVISVWSPGEHIRVASSDNGYIYYSGTSIAAAIHSSAIAHIVGGYYTNHPDGKYSKAKNFLYSLDYKISSDRPHMIDLTLHPEKYIDRNVISTVRSQIKNASDIMLNSRMDSIGIPAGVQGTHKFFFTTGVESVEVIEGDLPHGLSFKDGFIVGQADDIETNTELHVFRVQFKMMGVNVYHQKTLRVQLHRRMDNELS